MTATKVITTRSPLDQDWPKVVRFGLLLALASVFISLIGMPQKLDGRIVVEPYISMGYLALLWLPVMLGYAVSAEKVLEGMVAHAKGAREVVAGTVVGLFGGAGLALLIWGLDTRDLSDPLVNWGDNLLELLVFDESVVYGVMVWLAISAGLGFVGGLLHVAPKAVTRAVIAAVIAVFLTAALESALDDISEGFRLEWLFEWLFERRGGLRPRGAVVIMVAATAYSLLGRTRTAAVKARYDRLENDDRKVANAGLLIAAAAATIILPLFLGKLTNELLANVGLFLLLALGLNIVVGLAGILDLGYCGRWLHHCDSHFSAVARPFTGVAVAGCPYHRGCGGSRGRSVHRCPGHTDAGGLSRYRHPRLRRDHPPHRSFRLGEWADRRCPGHHRHPWGTNLQDEYPRNRFPRSRTRSWRRPARRLLSRGLLLRRRHLHQLASRALSSRPRLDGGPRGRISR